MTTQDYAYRMASALLRAQYETGVSITLPLIKDSAGRVVVAAEGIGEGELNLDALERKLEAEFNVQVPDEDWLDDPRDHFDWLPEWRADNDWHFWNRYRQYLDETINLKPAAVRKLNSVTDGILERLESPARDGAWDRRGMVVGQVQSGKTSNYTGLICKAADAGYKLIIVLAGSTESLRSQTQLRLDEGFLGWDTRRQANPDSGGFRVGVGMLSKELLRAHSGTTSADGNDFNRRVSAQFGTLPGSTEPMLLVVKKNVSILDNVERWATSIVGEVNDNSGRSIVRDVPLLLIDDEADYASVNTTSAPLDENGNPDTENDPSAINGRIRTLLLSFEKSAYIGYTATPFANIFIHGNTETEEHGEDLFPRDFIANLRPPTNYIGPTDVFGIDQDENGAWVAKPPLPIVREIADYSDWMPDRHKKIWTPATMPISLKKAVRAFILSMATRRVRDGRFGHNSMLVHVTRFTNVQTIIAEQIEDEIDDLRNRIRYGDGGGAEDIRSILRDEWANDYSPTTNRFNELRPDLAAEHTVVKWSDVERYLDEAVQRIQVRRINGTARDTLEYWDHPDGLQVIAIGGDKLSRGLTLEGLTVSYYLRASRMYDTLMQMGRWFGYRPGYGDLCRLYTSTELSEWYEDITVASEQLRGEFDRMSREESSPTDFGLKVRSHSALRITSAVKMRHAQPMKLVYESRFPQSTKFRSDGRSTATNIQELNRFVRELSAISAPRKVTGNYVWDGINRRRIAEYLVGYQSHPRLNDNNPGQIAEYITAQHPSEIKDWTVAIISNTQAKGDRYQLDDIAIGLTERRAKKSDNTVSIGVLTNPSDESLDFSKSELATARETLCLDPNDIVSGPRLRLKRPKDRALLLIYLLDILGDDEKNPLVGFAMSFPSSDTAIEHTYHVNNVTYQQAMFGL